MKNLIITTMLLFACFVSSAPSVLAQGLEHPSNNQFSFAGIGIFAARTGTALGPSGHFEINPLRWAGLCSFVSPSNAASNTDGGSAHDWDFSSGMCAIVPPPEIRGFFISPFAQLAYQNNDSPSALPIADGAIFRDGDDPQPRQALPVGGNHIKVPAPNKNAGLHPLGEDHSTRTWAIMNAINVGTSFAAASASYHGAVACTHEARGLSGPGYSLHENPWHNFRQSLSYALPFDVGVGIASYALRHRHGTIAKLLPLMSASAQSGLAGMNYSAGCF